MQRKSSVPTHKKIAVIGQGVIGLTSAYRLLDAGYQVDILSKDPFADTTSHAAGAYWWPHKAYPQARISDWAEITYKIYVEEARHPETGIHFEKHLRFCIDPDESAYARMLVEDWQEIDGRDYGIDCAEAFLMRLPVIDVPKYMPLLRGRVESKGADIQIHKVEQIEELFPDYDLVINCSGIGANRLVNDQEVFPIRGQVVRTTNPGNIHASTRIYQKQGEFTLVLPRSEDIILGGTSQNGDWCLNPRDEDTQDILSRCQRVVPALKDCDLIDTSVGLRPGRHEVRLDMEWLAEGQPVIHNYGHGGGGFTVAWGCADEVQHLAQSYLNSCTDLGSDQLERLKH